MGGFLFPTACLGCEASGRLHVCADCRLQLIGSLSLVSGVELLTLGRYEGVLRRCLTAIKQEGRKAVARELAELAAQRAVERWGDWSAASIHAVHSSRQGQRFRGFSLPQMIAQSVLVRTDCRLLDKELEGRFPTTARSSQGMSLEERLGRHSLAGAPSPAVGAPDRGNLLIVDDVVTSGATLSRSVAVAQDLGFSKIVCLALAHAADD